MAGIELHSTAFNDRTPIPGRYTLDGENVSPPLIWSAPPKGTTELVLLCEDPDAPSGTFVHWLVTGIDPDSSGVAEGDVPDGGTAHRNDFGDHGWDGPQPPVGDRPHRYRFRLYAVPEPVPLPEAATAEQVHRTMSQHGLASGLLTGLHQR